VFLTRSGHTVLELLIALGVGAIVMSLGATIGFRHQRFHRDVVIAVARAETLDQLVALMPISIRGIAPGEGDVAPGAARDTSLEFRAVIGSAVVCDSGGNTVIVAPNDSSRHLSSVLVRPAAGDTAWFLDVSAAQQTWVPRAIIAVLDSSAVCHLGSTSPFGTEPRVSLGLRFGTPAPPRSSVVRVTRPWRYSIYRASDGAWYLGAKEWNPAAAKFNGIQPVAGPLVPAAAGGLRFRYIDSSGLQLPSVPPDPRRIAAIDVGFRVDSVIPGSYGHATSIRGRTNVVIGLRNRWRE
jgi:hypothetical protein